MDCATLFRHGVSLTSCFRVGTELGPRWVLNQDCGAIPTSIAMKPMKHSGLKCLWHTTVDSDIDSLSFQLSTTNLHHFRCSLWAVGKRKSAVLLQATEALSPGPSRTVRLFVCAGSASNCTSFRHICCCFWFIITGNIYLVTMFINKC